MSEVEVRLIVVAKHPKAREVEVRLVVVAKHLKAREVEVRLIVVAKHLKAREVEMQLVVGRPQQLQSLAMPLSPLFPVFECGAPKQITR
ncbi:hypothetical protein [Pelagibius sp. 7325]|uniref:hypothetical protein n=1 Tax=Pelagibius sp. 7325 TaxID=3131994 RepID=UPI0030ED8A5B